LNNESNGEAIYPTPIIGMVGIIENSDQFCTMSFKNEGDLVVLIGENKEEIGGSEYLKLFHDLETGLPPQIDLCAEKAVQDSCRESIEAGILSSAHDCSDGGLAVTLAECCMKGKKGVQIELDEKFRSDAVLFGETQSRIIVSLSAENLTSLETIAHKYEVPLKILGIVSGDSLKIKGLIDLKIEVLTEAWKGIK